VIARAWTSKMSKLLTFNRTGRWIYPLFSRDVLQAHRLIFRFLVALVQARFKISKQLKIK
jgi:hypothetical protein